MLTPTHSKPLVVAVMGASGAGKTTAVNALISEYPGEYQRVQSHTTRPPQRRERIDGTVEVEREGEYAFCTPAEFKATTFLESDFIYGHYYGIAEKTIDRLDPNRTALVVLDPSNIEPLRKALSRRGVTMITARIDREESDRVACVLARKTGDARRRLADPKTKARLTVKADIVARNNKAPRDVAVKIHPLIRRHEMSQQKSEGLDRSAFESRANHIGGSEVSAVIGKNPYQTEFGLFARKMLGHKERRTDAKERVLKMGNVLEQMLIDEFVEQNPEYDVLHIEQQPEYVIPDRKGKPAIVVHPDAHCVIKPKKGVSALHHTHILEIKTSNIFATDLSAPTPPEYMEIQTQMEMHAARENGSDVKYTTLFCMDRASGRTRKWKVTYDGKRAKEMVEKTLAWKRRYMDLSDGETDLNKLTVELANRCNIALPEELEINVKPDSWRTPEGEAEEEKVGRQLNALSQAFANRKKANDLYDNCVNWLKTYMGERERLVLDGQSLASYKPTTRTTGGEQVHAFANQLLEEDEHRRLADRIREDLRKAGYKGLKQADLREVVTARLTPLVQRVAKVVFDENTKKTGRTFRPSHKAIGKMLELNPGWQKPKRRAGRETPK